MRFALADLVVFASALMRLEPGDILLTGAPPEAEPGEPRWLRDGDLVEVEVERLGRLRNPVRAPRRR